MAFMALKTIVFQNEKKTFQLRNFVPFIVCLLPGLVNYSLRWHYFCQGKVPKGIGVTKSNVFKEFVMILLASTRVFHKKSQFILISVIFDVLL